MKSRIRWDDMKSDPLHIVWVIGYALAFGAALNLIPVFGIKLLTGYRMPSWFGLAPFVEAGGLRIAEGIDRFSGKEIKSVWTPVHTHIILSIVMCYVIAPPLFVWGLRERILWRQGSGQRRFPTKITLALGLSGSIMMAALLVSILPPFIAYSVRTSMMNVQRVQANKDALINDISYVALRAQSFCQVDVKDGGGGGRWMNIQRNGNTTIGIDEIGLTSPITGDVVGKLYPQQPSRFFLTVHSTDSLTIKGVATEQGDLSNFENTDGRRGRIQMSVAVTPKRIVVTSDN